MNLLYIKRASPVAIVLYFYRRDIVRLLNNEFLGLNNNSFVLAHP